MKMAGAPLEHCITASLIFRASQVLSHFFNPFGTNDKILKLNRENNVLEAEVLAPEDSQLRETGRQFTGTTTGSDKCD